MKPALYRRAQLVCYKERGGAYVVVNVQNLDDTWSYDIASPTGRMNSVPEGDLRPAEGDRRYEPVREWLAENGLPPEQETEPWLVK